MLLFDSHCHLDHPDFASDLDQVLDRAAAAGVYRILVPGSDLDSSRRALELARQYPQMIHATVGIHPHEAAGWSDQVEVRLVELLDKSKAKVLPAPVALGEIGLDYHYDFSPRDRQQEVFRHQIRLARQRGLPLIIHTREAWPDTTRIMEQEQAWRCGGVMHCFLGSIEQAAPFLEWGFHLGVTGMITFRRAGHLEDLVRECPPDRLLIETDGPYLAPHPHRGKRNEPAHVALVAEKLAEWWNIPAAAAAHQAACNTCRCFSLPLPQEP